MKVIKAIEIYNFRSIVSLQKNLQPNHLNIIVGQNDIGKSNVLKALNLFFNDETDLNTSFRFVDDFSHYASTPNKKAEEITIKITFNSHERYKTSEDLVWKKVWRKTGLHKNDIHTISGKAPSNRSGALQWVKKIKYKYVPAVRGQEYFNHLMGDLHDALSEINPSAFSVASGNFLLDLKSQVTTLVDDIATKLGYSSEIGMPSDFKLLFSTLDFGLSANGRIVSLNKRGDGIKAQHIPLILKFIANHFKSVSGKAIINPDTIWGFEEPENNMEMGNAFKLSKIFLTYSSDLQIFINTHSPAFYSLAKDNHAQTNLYLVKSDKSDESTIVSQVQVTDTWKLDEEVGILPVITEYVKKEVELRQVAEMKIEELNKLKSNTRYLILTEDKDTKFCKNLFQFQGFGDEETEYISYESRSNLSAAIQSCKVKISDKPKLERIIFHRDSDIYDDDEFDFESINKKISRLNESSTIVHTLFKTAGYDLESYFVNAKHISALYSSLTEEETQEFINEATEEVREKSLDKLLVKLETFREKYAKEGRIAQFSPTKYIKKLTAQYDENPSRYRYGKSVLGVLCSKLQKKLGRNVNLLQNSNELVVLELRALLKADTKMVKKQELEPVYAIGMANQREDTVSSALDKVEFDTTLSNLSDNNMAIE